MTSDGAEPTSGRSSGPGERKHDMREYPSDVAFTPAVKVIQSQKGSRSSYAALEQRGGWQTVVTPDLESFLADLDMFYLGTANAEGQPYIQYRGGAPGFLKVLSDRTLGFADFRGNRQYISLGNLSENPRAFIFLMDYVHRRRIKLWGKARVVEGDEDLQARLRDPDYPGRVERVILFEIEAWDSNCPQHIHRRLPLESVRPFIEQLQQRVQELEERLADQQATSTASRQNNRDPPPSHPEREE
jgi:predicted pyridoxine 5'-phosphate oxidase superfamily flavin-nucleotide-binding protein